MFSFPKNVYDMSPLLQALDVSVGNVINDKKLENNCYYCSVAFLKGMNTSDLVKLTGIKQNRTVTIDKVRELMDKAGLNYYDSDFQHITDVERYFNGIPLNAKFGFIFTTMYETGHMVVGRRDSEGRFTLYDPQRSTEIPHEEIDNYLTQCKTICFCIMVIKE
ncbi:TPA: hypothetical protein ACMDNU_003676 [Vibrio cholerae]